MAAALEQEYYIPNESPVQDWQTSKLAVNRFSAEDLNIIVADWHHNSSKTIVLRNNFVYCDLAPNKKSGGHPQATISKRVRGSLSVKSSNEQWKELVHLVYWRYLFEGALIPEGLEISHTSTNQSNLSALIAESHRLNETRKGCHHYRWECPHTYYPCLYEE
jgi:hypothetical protein